MGDKFTTNVSGSTVGAIAVGDHASATGTAGARKSAVPTQEEHRAILKQTQTALVHDQDAIDQLDARMYEALGQFLRVAREIQVEQKSLADLQAKMKVTLDEVWAEQIAKGLRPQVIPKTLEVAKALTENPLMVEVAKKLIGL